MAQYQKSFYSTSLYGRLNAFVGDYKTEVFDAQENFTSGINCFIEAELPKSFYDATSKDIVPDQHWSIENDAFVTSTSEAKIEMEATGDFFEAHFLYQNVENHRVLITLYQEEMHEGESFWIRKQEIEFNTYSSSNSGKVGKVLFNTHGFANHKIVVKTQSVWEKAKITFKGFRIQTTNVSLSLQTSADGIEWSELDDILLTQTANQEAYILEGRSNVYKDIRYIQGSLVLMSSDNNTNPNVHRIEFRSNESELYDYDGDYMVQLDMVRIANTSNQVFKQLTAIKWEETKPNGTELIIRSSSSVDGIFWGPITAPYRKDVQRIRLKNGVEKHSLTIGPINESNKFDHSTIHSYQGLTDQSYLPKDEIGSSITYLFSKKLWNQESPENFLQSIKNPTKDSIFPLEFEPQPYYLTVELSRKAMKGSPVVDFINIDQIIEYKEDAHIADMNVSSVDNLGTGVVSLLKIGDYEFSYPNGEEEIELNRESIESAKQTYLLTDLTNRPSDIILYFESEKDQSNRSNVSDNTEDIVSARTIVRNIEQGETQGIVKHVQYSAGNVSFLRPNEKEMDSSFTPVLEKKKKYRYFITNGWPNEYHVVLQNQTLEDISQMYDCTIDEIVELNQDILKDESDHLLVGQKLLMPNKTINKNIRVHFKNRTPYTEKSSHNAMVDQQNGEEVVDFSSESIIVIIPVQPDVGYVEWSSPEKIYKGVINLGNTREPFIRTQLYRSLFSTLEREYIVQEGDTWESIALYFDVSVIDLKHINEDISLDVGLKIKIPASIVLPEIPPEVEFDERIYTISIVEDSVYKKTGEKLHESFIPIDWNGKYPPLSVKYKKGGSSPLTADLVRGSGRNGMDPLPYGMIREIVSIENQKTGQKYLPYSAALGVGDYILTNNYVDWSPSSDDSMEPNEGDIYTVTYIKEEVESVNVYLDTTYIEKIGADLAWRSPEIKVIDGICTPNEDFLLELPPHDSFDSYNEKYKDVGYVIEDNDIWVETSIKYVDDKPHLFATLNGRDPSVNWHPKINTGHYYLKEDEYYMYSEPLRTTVSQKELPRVENIEYITTDQGVGALLLPPSNNLVRDSALVHKDKKVALVFNADSL